MGIIKNGFAVIKSNLKIFVCKFTGTNITINNAVSLISPRAILKTSGKESQLFFGCKTTIRSNTEISATGGTIHIGNNCFVNRNCMIVSHEKISIEDNVTIGPGTYIYDHDHDGKGGYLTKPVTIKRGVWIGAGCIILKGVTIGEDAVVAAGSVVVRDVPSKKILLQKRSTEYIDRI